MKRISAFVISFLSVLILYNCCAAAAPSTLTKDQETLLRLVEVIDDNADWDKLLTRGEFAQLIAKVAFERNSSAKTYVFGSGVSDVKKGQRYYDEITALYNRGFIITDKFGRFDPNAEITADDAIEIIMRTLGYSENSPQIYGSFGASATKKGILDDVAFDESRHVSLFNAYILIYNMLKCDITDLRDPKLDDSNNKLIYMSVRLGLYEIKGIVTDDGNKTMYGDSKAGEGHIIIDNGDEMINQTGRDDLFGLNICGYFFYDRIQEYTLLAAYERTGKNTVTEIMSRDIDDFKNRTYTYFADEYASSTKKIKVPKNAAVIYNGRPLSVGDTFTDDMYIPENGYVRLYDNNGDNTVDFLMIENYITEIVEVTNIKEETIYVKNDRPFYDLDGKKYEIYDRENNKIGLADIGNRSVISVMISPDNERYKIIVSKELQTETVKSYYGGSESESAYVRTSSDGKYTFSDYAKKYYGAPQMNTLYDFVFDAFDNVAGYFKSETNLDWQYGFLLSVFNTEGPTGDEYAAKIYTQMDDFRTYPLSSKVKIIDAQKIDPVSYKAQAVMNKMRYTSYDGTEKNRQGIIRFKVDASGLLTDIEIPYNYNELNTEDQERYNIAYDYSGPLPDSEDRLYCIADTVSYEKCPEDYKNSSGYEDPNRYKTGEVAGNGFTYGGAAFITNKTINFKVPSDTGDRERFSILDYSSLYANGKIYPLYIFGTSSKNKNAKCVQYTSDDSASFVKRFENEWPSVVTDVHVSYDEREDEEIYTIVSGSTEYYIKKENYEGAVINLASGDGNTPVRIGPGDIIYMKTNSNRYITGAVLAYDADREVSDKDGSTVTGAIAGTVYSYYGKDPSGKWLCSPFSCGSSFSTENPHNGKESWQFAVDDTRIFAGWVYSYEDGCMLITNQNLSENAYDPSLKRNDGYLTEAVDFDLSFTTVIAKGRKGKVSAERATNDDIKPYTVYGNNCSRVVVSYYKYALRNICIYNFD